MGSVLHLPALSAEERSRLQRYHAVRQNLRLRINQRARELAARDQERYFTAILWEIYRGELDPEIIPFWEPPAGGVCRA